jgi:WD40-like Beta Propeller Repeat
MASRPLELRKRIAKDVNPRGGEGKDLTIRTLYLPVMVAAAVLACVVAAVTTLLVVSKEAESAFPGKSGRIAFSATTPDPASPGLNWQIFTIKPDGTSEKQLTRTYDSAWLNSSPSYSSDGKKIAWIKHGNIWVMDADGTGKVRLTSGRTDGDPAFSPDGRRLAFTRCDGIWVKKLKGSKDARRVTAKNDGYEEYGPVFRPGGAGSPSCATRRLADAATAPARARSPPCAPMARASRF